MDVAQLWHSKTAVGHIVLGPALDRSACYASLENYDKALEARGIHGNPNMSLLRSAQIWRRTCQTCHHEKRPTVS